MIDEIDQQILAILQENARISNADIARLVGMAPSAVLERIRKLEQRGVIQGYETRLDPRQIGLGLLAFVFVKTDQHWNPEIDEAVARIPHVQEVHHIAGEDCYLVKVRVANTDDLGHLLRHQFGSIPGIQSTKTTVVLSTIRETGLLTVPSEKEEVNV
jgi:Lrp/AsnC family transcriptional regulator, leucine-responsive regulatory protein